MFAILGLLALPCRTVQAAKSIRAPEKIHVRFTRRLSDGRGHIYIVTIFAKDEKMEINRDAGSGLEAGAKVYSGTYRAGLRKEGFSSVRIQPVLLFSQGRQGEFAEGRDQVYVLPGKAGGQPDVLVVAVYETSNTRAFRMFFVQNGKLVPVLLQAPGKRPTPDWDCSLPIKAVGPYKFQTMTYYNGDDSGPYHHWTWLFVPQKRMFTQIEFHKGREE